MTTEVPSGILPSVREARADVLANAEKLIASVVDSLGSLETAAIDVDRLRNTLGSNAQPGDAAELELVIRRQQDELDEARAHRCPPAQEATTTAEAEEQQATWSELQAARRTITELEKRLAASEANTAEYRSKADVLTAELEAARTESGARIEEALDGVEGRARADALRIVEALAADNPDLPLSESMSLVQIAYNGAVSPLEDQDETRGPAAPARLAETQPEAYGSPDGGQADNFANYGETPAADAFIPDPRPFVQGTVPDEEDQIKDGNFFDAPPAWNDDTSRTATDASFDFEFNDSTQPAKASA